MFRKTLLKGLISVFILSSLLAGCSDANRPKEELLKEGMGHIENKNSRGAIVLLKNALEKDQNYFEARFQLARAYYNLNNFDSAEKELQKVIRQNPSLAGARVMLARLDLQKMRADDALEQISGLYGDSSTDADALEAAGLAFAVKEDYGTASKLLEKAYRLGTKDHTAGVALSRLYMVTGRAEKARSQVLDVLAKDKDNLGALFLLAELQMSTGEQDQAIGTYDRVLESNPGMVQALFKKGVLLVEKGAYDDALSIAAGIMEKDSKRPEGYRLKGMALLYKKDFDNSIVALQKTAAMSSDPGTYYFLGLAHYYKGELELAMSQMQKSLDIMPAVEQPRTLLAIILLKQNRFDDAAREAGKVVDANPSNALAHNILGSAYMAKGDYDKGMNELNRAVEIDPSLIDAHIKKGVFKLSKGNIKEAEIDLKTAVEVAPELLNSRVMLANYYAGRKEFEKALDTLQSGLNGTERDALLHNLSSEVYLRQNNVEQAVASLEKAKKANPDFFSPYFNLSTLYFLTGKPDKGIAELRGVVERSPENLKAILALASILESKNDDAGAAEHYAMASKTGKAEGLLAEAAYKVKKKDTSGAMKLIDRAIEMEPSKTAPYEMKGRLLMSLKNSDGAMKVFEELEKINPRLGITYIINALVSMERPADAISRLNQELRKDPRNIGLKAEVSRVYMIMGQKDRALANARDIVRTDPSSAAGYSVLSMIYTREGEPDKAIEVLKEGIEASEKDANMLMMLGDVHMYKAEHASALGAYKKAEDAGARNVQAIFKQGTALEKLGERGKAIGEYQRVLRLSMDHVPALNNLAYLYAEDARELDRALQAATRAYMLAPNEGAVADTLGYVLLKKGKHEDAYKVLEKAVELRPGDPTIRYHFALACEKTGKRPRAVESLEKALTLGGFKDSAGAGSMLEKLKSAGGR